MSMCGYVICNDKTSTYFIAKNIYASKFILTQCEG